MARQAPVGAVGRLSFVVSEARKGTTMAGRIREWAGRLTGFSTPLGGASWVAPPSERQIAAELLAQLEDRRVLYNPSDAESPMHCVSSVIEIRRLLSASLARLEGSGVLADHIRAMATASRRFLDRVQSKDDPDYRDVTSPGHWRSWEFFDALGQMRGIFGVHLAIVAARYSLDVQEGLAGILPSETQPDDLAV